MKIRFRRPANDEIGTFVADQAEAKFSYAQLGMTKHPAPDDFQVDHNRIVLGKGQAIFEKVCAAVHAWQMIDLGWVSVYDASVPFAPGMTVAIIAEVFGVWFLNACRIVYTVEERSGEVWRYGFAYGTLPAHLERGEERFLIEWDRRSDEVRYDILAYSQPNTWLAKVGYPVVRLFQKRFGKDSKRVMASIVMD
ncbi:MAG: DUF1990 domain-containing protein [Caldilineaceae bacterium]